MDKILKSFKKLSKDEYNDLPDQTSDTPSNVYTKTNYDHDLAKYKYKKNDIRDRKAANFSLNYNSKGGHGFAAESFIKNYYGFTEGKPIVYNNKKYRTFADAQNGNEKIQIKVSQGNSLNFAEAEGLLNDLKPRNYRLIFFDVKNKNMYDIPGITAQELTKLLFSIDRTDNDDSKRKHLDEIVKFCSAVSSRINFSDPKTIKLTTGTALANLDEKQKKVYTQYAGIVKNVIYSAQALQSTLTKTVSEELELLDYKNIPRKDPNIVAQYYRKAVSKMLSSFRDVNFHFLDGKTFGNLTIDANTSDTQIYQWIKSKLDAFADTQVAGSVNKKTNSSSGNVSKSRLRAIVSIPTVLKYFSGKNIKQTPFSSLSRTERGKRAISATYANFHTQGDLTASIIFARILGFNYDNVKNTSKVRPLKKDEKETKSELQTISQEANKAIENIYKTPLMKQNLKEIRKKLNSVSLKYGEKNV